jgi:hypothetical protein
MEEFKKISSNELANKVFKKLIKRVRDDKSRRFGGMNKGYLPFNLNRMLDYVSHMGKRE